MKFQTSQELLITGVRIYRVDSHTVTASLWESDGSRLAKGDFSPGADHGWQDMNFDNPVTIVPGRTYVASYYTPRAKYAFQYEYFAGSALTVGPITALRSVDGTRTAFTATTPRNADPSRSVVIATRTTGSPRCGSPRGQAQAPR